MRFKPNRLTTLVVAIAIAALTPAASACPECGCEATSHPESATTAPAHNDIAPASEPAHMHDAVESHAHGHGDTYAHTHTRTVPEADRRAILAMAGEYKVTFQFEETVATQPGYRLRDPYHAEAAEFVQVVEDRGDFISLQHVLVLHADSEEPRVVKHWRQDWTFEDTELLAYRGHRTWEHQSIRPEQARGTWTQAVYQVDDSPRYESYGAWTHTGERSAWESQPTWRPLPRREYSKRSDYDVMVARNRHTITPQGWVHEQDNHKLVLGDDGQPSRVIAHESGLNVYDRTDDVDFSAGRRYWDRTASFWRDVRSLWRDAFERHGTVALRGEVDGQRLHAALFALARDAGEQGRRDVFRKKADDTLRAFLIDKY